jgi:hypothetical protein
VPHEPSGDAADRRSAEDAAWRAIVANYGDRPVLDQDPAPADPEVASPFADPTALEVPEEPEPLVAPVAGPDPVVERATPAEEHYVPPPPPPVPRAEPRRLIAWLGLFGSPALLLLALVLGVSIPSWLGLVLMVWFVGGFIFLVASMRPGPRDDDDDGAVV